MGDDVADLFCEMIFVCIAGAWEGTRILLMSVRSLLLLSVHSSLSLFWYWTLSLACFFIRAQHVYILCTLTVNCCSICFALRECMFRVYFTRNMRILCTFNDFVSLRVHIVVYAFSVYFSQLF